MSVTIMVISAAIGILTASIIAVGMALAISIMAIGVALVIGAAILGQAVSVGTGIMLGLAMMASIAIIGMSIIAIGAFMVISFLFTGLLIASIIGLLAGTIATLIFLFLFGLFLIGETALKIWDLVKPYWDIIKGIWDKIKLWWENSFIKKILDDVDAAGGWMNWISNLFNTAIDNVKKWFADTKIGKWIDSIADWWRNFSFKNFFMDLWDKIKKWLVGIWDTVCDTASKFGITYPNGLSMGLGWTKWKVPYPTVSISTAVWYPFSFMKNDKADVPIVTPEAIE
jgi:hypothetical protein